MFLHLNQVSFQNFGTILPERRTASPVYGGEVLQILRMTTGSPEVYRAEADTVLFGFSGTAILSVSEDNITFQDYYLDKPVSVRSGIYFCVTAFRGSGEARLASNAAPKVVGIRTLTPEGSADRPLRVERMYTFFYHEKEQGFLFAGESHPMLELTYVDQHSLHSVADGQDLLLEQGDMVLYGPGQWHMQYADIGVAPRYVTISFDVSGQDLSPLYNRRFRSPQKALPLLQQMLREQERMKPYAGDMIITLLTQLLLTLLRETDTPTEKLQPSHTIRSENDFISLAQQYVSNHIRERLTVPIVAKNVGISPSYLTALFHKHLQISPGEYIRRIKLQESKQMIREDSMNFTQIAAALQYSTVHHFSRQFKEKFGITPSEYAKSVR